MNFEAFLHFQEKHRQFLEDEEARKVAHIRLATHADLPDILLLLPHLWPDAPLSEDRIRTLLQADFQADSKKQWAVARNQEGILGAISMRVLEPLWNNTPILHIEELIVLSESQRQGIGSKFIRFAENFAKEKCCSQLELDCGLLRRDAHLFYLKHGFQEVSKYFSKRIIVS